ncbi:MAG: oligoendopeptidase F [Syntrophomonadaceae bacterium]
MKGKAKLRSEIDPLCKWRLEDIYKNEDEWENDFSSIGAMLQKVEQYQGQLGSSAATMLQAFKDIEELERRSEKLYVYARMRRDENNGDNRYQALADRIETLSIHIGSATAFLVPELNSLEKQSVLDFMTENPELKLYEHYFDELWRQKEHILSFEEEKLLAMSADLAVASKNIFTMLNNADIKFPTIKDENGQQVEITKGRLGRLLESYDRRVRKDAFEGLYDSYGKLKNTLGSTLSASIKSDIFYSRARRYPNALNAALDSDNISTEVYDNLIKTVHSKLPYLHRYIELRKKLLGLSELHFYDLYVPLVNEYKMEIPYEKALKMVMEGIAPLGDAYAQKMKEGLNSGWIDVYENEGKTSGAYSWGAYDTHPYVLMNYDQKLDDLFTLAHEMGHSLHSAYSNQAQPYVYSRYPIFLAEVASTVNESLLIDYLMKKSSDREEKLYLINHYLEQFRGTVYRQTMFAEFEKLTHEKAEAGEALTPELFNQIYLDLNRSYYGPELVLDEQIALEWSRIPHFYSAFYVYKYATGFSAATAIKEMIEDEGRPAVERYLEFLQSGGSDYPVKLLQKAGVDLATPQPIEKALDFFGELLNQAEALI